MSVVLLTAGANKNNGRTTTTTDPPRPASGERRAAQHRCCQVLQQLTANSWVILSNMPPMHTARLLMMSHYLPEEWGDFLDRTQPPWKIQRRPQTRTTATMATRRWPHNEQRRLLPGFATGCYYDDGRYDNDNGHCNDDRAWHHCRCGGGRHNPTAQIAWHKHVHDGE